MTAKEKANELKRLFGDSNSNANYMMHDCNDLGCALICINQMILYTSTQDKDQPYVILRDRFLLEVKDEILKQIKEES